MKSCQVASISKLNASFDPIGSNLIGVLVDDINSSSSSNISSVALVDAIILIACTKH